VTVAESEGTQLPALARASVVEALRSGSLPSQSIPPPSGSGALSATFVTIKKDGALRGCMGTTVARRPLLDDVRSQALAAAFRDPRFSPVQAEELPQLTFEVSVLGEERPLAVTSWEEACSAIRKDVDGVIVRTAVGGALFLPQVWENFDRAEDFLDQLWKKAGLSRRYFETDVKLSVFSVEKFSEPEPPDPGRS
jgi:AmmeMemoRadiSam system protein A